MFTGRLSGTLSHVGCCIAIALIIGIGRRGLYAPAPGRRPVDPGFAPPASRPAPGGAQERPAPGGAPDTSSPVAPTPAPEPSLTARVLAFAAVGAAVYAAGVAALGALGIATAAPHPAVSWLVRDAVVIALAAVAFAAAGGGTAFARSPDPVALALIGLGGAWFWLGVLDMHAFGLFQIARGELLADLAFHGAGSAAMALGAARLVSHERRALEAS